MSAQRTHGDGLDALVVILIERSARPTGRSVATGVVMTRLKMCGVAVLVACCLVGCAGAATLVVREPVTVVPTRTAGVTFVIVRPADNLQASTVQQPGDGGAVMPASDYILVCDARATTGMQCAIPAEAALARYSYTPQVSPGPTNVDEGVGTLNDVASTPQPADEPTADKPAPANAPQVPAFAPAPAPTTPPLMAPTPPPSSEGATP